MNNTFLIRFSAIAAALSVVAIASTAAAGRLPRPLGAGEQRLSPGVHVLDLVSREQGRPGYAQLPGIAVTLPSGWFNYNGWAVNDGGPLGLAFWDVAQVYPTGCRWQGKPMIDPGRTVDGLARVLAARPLRHASRPTDVVLAGFRGKYLRWSVPSKINFSRCGQGYFESWKGRGWATDRWQQGPGQVDRLWILDVEGHRLVIDANYMPSATRKQRAELERIVHSIKFLAVSSLGTIHVGAAGSSASPGCAQLRQLKSVFPRASAVGFRARQPINAQRGRHPIWPGRCGAFWTTYSRYKTSGASFDVSVTLYKTAADLAAPLAEAAYGQVRTLRNGARVRTFGPSPAGVNGAPASDTGVVSAYRRIFISSLSISLAKTPVPISAQLRVHRQIEAAFRALGAVPRLEATVEARLPDAADFRELVARAPAVRVIRGPAALPGTSRGELSAQLELRPAVVRLRGRDNVVVSRLPVDSLQVLPVGALEQGGQAFRWRSLRPVHGTWVITLPAPLLRGIYPLRLRTRAGRRSFRSARWFLRVFPAGTLSLPSFENPRDVVRWWVRTGTHGTNVTLRRWPLPAWDRRDTRLHRLFVVAYSPPGRPDPSDRLGVFVTAFRDGYSARWRFLEAKLMPY